jgi:hypothetical protein
VAAYPGARSAAAGVARAERRRAAGAAAARDRPDPREIAGELCLSFNTVKTHALDDETAESDAPADGRPDGRRRRRCLHGREARRRSGTAGGGGGGRRGRAAAGAAAVAPGRGADPIEQLKQLNELRQQGILTEEEFTAEKQKLIGQ